MAKAMFASFTTEEEEALSFDFDEHIPTAFSCNKLFLYDSCPLQIYNKRKKYKAVIIT